MNDPAPRPSSTDGGRRGVARVFQALKLSDADTARLRAHVKEARSRIEGRPTLAAACQALANYVFLAFEESLVLVRVFATVPFGELPERNQAFVRALLRERGVETPFPPAAPVLSLMGTRGAKPEWDDRRMSRGHLGIPLASTEFVDAIPMIARLLAEFGLAIEGIGGGGARIVRSKVGNLSGMFYVADARSETDGQGRLVISAQDFVAEHGVRTVFGFGGAYMLERSYVAIILFARETVDPDHARELAPLSSALKAATMRTVDQGRFF